MACWEGFYSPKVHLNSFQGLSLAFRIKSKLLSLASKVSSSTTALYGSSLWPGPCSYRPSSMLPTSFYTHPVPFVSAPLPCCFLHEMLQFASVINSNLSSRSHLLLWLDERLLLLLQIMLPFYHYYHQLTIDCLLSTKYCVKHFTWLSLFNYYNIPMNSVLQRGRLGLER